MNTSATCLPREPDLDDMICSLQATVKQPRGIYKEIREAAALSLMETIPDFTSDGIQQGGESEHIK